ncbi:hypothetical protein DICVIV_02315 [Dictyocaulus viviparus]|uniref:Uncharacterized protein n=1 Tax=Dictyocaulus viviparus TaxID=29172 RepID=A0A0D8Y5L6_DICVI|nr:hypothetical protein DICVIV_02315 [Dictyocaulus viviparus]
MRNGTTERLLYNPVQKLNYTTTFLEENIHDDSDTLLAIRNRLSDISLTCFEPLETPTAEKISVMKFNEQRDAYIADLRAGRIPFNVVESVKPIVSTSSVTDNPMISEISQRKSDKQDHTENAEMTKTTKTDDVQTHTSKSDERIVTFEESQNTKVETKPIDPNRTSSSYQKMIGILGQMDTSDTDDDAVGLAKTATTHEKPRSLNPPSQQKSSNTLSQYLFTAQKADAATSSDSDDDFFK